MHVFCTIITKDHLPLAKALHASLNRQTKDTVLKVLVVDGEISPVNDGPAFLYPGDLESNEFFRLIEKKYAHTNADQFRWALKPVLIGHLLKEGYSKVIFLDPDLYFVNNFQFLIDLLDLHAVVLTPHWADLDVINSEDSVLSVLRNGLFNAGFVAASRQGLTAIEWWAAMCHYKTEKKPELGIYDDQKYLDMLPVQFDNVHILKHQGCNLASWNIITCKREITGGRLMINQVYEPVFIHFAKDTVVNILNRNDALLQPYLDEYMQLLSGNGFDLLGNIYKFTFSQYDSPVYKIKHKIRLRTRFKRFLYKLAEKL